MSVHESEFKYPEIIDAAIASPLAIPSTVEDNNNLDTEVGAIPNEEDFWPDSFSSIIEPHKLTVLSPTAAPLPPPAQKPLSQKSPVKEKEFKTLIVTAQWENDQSELLKNSLARLQNLICSSEIHNAPQKAPHINEAQHYDRKTAAEINIDKTKETKQILNYIGQDITRKKEFPKPNDESNIQKLIKTFLERKPMEFVKAGGSVALGQYITSLQQHALHAFSPQRFPVPRQNGQQSHFSLPPSTASSMTQHNSQSGRSLTGTLVKK